MEKITITNIPRRERLFNARYDDTDNASSNTMTSRYSYISERGEGTVVTGSSCSVSNSGGGNLCMLNAVLDKENIRMNTRIFNIRSFPSECMDF